MEIHRILRKLKQGDLTVEEAEKALRCFMLARVENIANLDVKRHIRRGLPEIIYGADKSPDEIVKIASEMARHTGSAIITRLTPNNASALRKLEGKFKVTVNDNVRLAIVRAEDYRPSRSGGRVGILTAGTSDIPRAIEAKVIAEELGCEVFMHSDVGIAGLHRLFQPLKKFVEKDVDAIIVAAGMEGALPSVVASLVDVPVIGLPTSTGYGYGAEGTAALMAMLQSCSLGLAVVNIDNGVAAGAFAALIANRAAKMRTSKSHPNVEKIPQC